MRKIHNFLILLTKVTLSPKQNKLSINPNDSINRLFVSTPKNDLATKDANKTSPIATSRSEIFSSCLSVKCSTDFSITNMKIAMIESSSK